MAAKVSLNRATSDGVIIMDKVRLNIYSLLLILSLTWNLSCGQDLIKKDYIIDCEFYAGNETSAKYMNDSLSLCKQVSPSSPIYELCNAVDTMNDRLSKCEHYPFVKSANISRVNITSSNNVCANFPSSSEISINLTNAEFCLNFCANKTETRFMSLCILARKAIEISKLSDLKIVNEHVNNTQLPSTKAGTTSKPTVASTTVTTTLKPSITTTLKPSITTVTSSTTKLVPVFDEKNNNKLANEMSSAEYTQSLTLSPEEQSNVDAASGEEGVGEDAPETIDQAEVPKQATYNKEVAPNDVDINNRPETFSIGYSDDGNSLFFVYFLAVVVFCILAYVLYHNKKKVIALIVEGRKERKRRPNTSQYRKLDNNLEEVMHSTAQIPDTNRRNNIIY